jgi:FlaA1/EpsC-like NDP-sugar epimerase
MGFGGEIFLLDMGEPVKIVRLAEEMIRLSGRRPYEDIEIAFTGLRPGEKLYEELLIKGEGVKPTNHEKIRILEAASSTCGFVEQKNEQLLTAIQGGNPEVLVATLKALVPEFKSNNGSKQPDFDESKEIDERVNVVG